MLSFLFERDSWYDPKKLRLVVPNFAFRNIFLDTDDLESDYCRVSDDELSTFCNYDPFPSPCKCVNNFP